MRLGALGAGVFGLFVLLAGCATTGNYTSADLALLPCEQGDAPIFFHPVEFDASGSPRYPDQIGELHHRLQSGLLLTDFIVFVHGWNKNPASAEVDYQQFICRLHARLRDRIGNEKRMGSLVVVGLFWPSTVTHETHEPPALLPFSYYAMRSRADTIGFGGMASLFASISDDIRKRRHNQLDINHDLPMRMSLIGHSFGARMLVQSLHRLEQDNALVPFLTSAEAVNVLLVNGALPPSQFNWILEAANRARQAGMPARFTPSTNSYLFNIHSWHDDANRLLFPIASAFDDDSPVCGVGACGVPGYPTACVNNIGKIVVDQTGPEPRNSVQFNAWNVDATQVIFGHTDIYKGRVATLLADLMYNKDVQARLPGPVAPGEVSGCAH